MSEYERPILSSLVNRLEESRGVIQVLAGPRQVGKTTMARQAVSKLAVPCHVASADEPNPGDASWIAAQWDAGRLLARDAGSRGALLVLDEVQKIAGWSESVKRLWDEDSAESSQLRVLILGSSPLLMQQGLTESLAGRFELIRVSHWSWPEMHDAFDWTIDEYVYFGGYPGSARFISDQERWARYVRDSLVETTVSRDILLLNRVDKPALLRQLFGLVCEYSGQILSYTKMLGSLQDAGNTTTLAHYLDLLSGAGLATGLEKYSGSVVARRGSIPKLLVLNTALMGAASEWSFDEARGRGDVWGRFVESSVGAHLSNTAPEGGVEIYYWREREKEVDFVLKRGIALAGVEVTSASQSHDVSGLSAFQEHYSESSMLLVGGQGISLEEFLSSPAERWLL